MWQLQRLDVVKTIVRHSGNIFCHKKKLKNKAQLTIEVCFVSYNI